MNISNVRFGFACNSSSTHSIISFDKTVNDTGYYPGYQSIPSYYGWDNFVLASEEEKRKYMATMLCYSLEDLPPTAARLVIKDWTGADPAEGVDHQSIFHFPRSYDEKLVDKKLFDEIMSIVLRKNVIIVGGNDNDEGHPLKGKSVIPLSILQDSEHICRYDDNYDHWSVFNPRNGTKVRFSFNDKPIVKSTFPELIDVKISDYCPYGCSFCYQGSTVKGKHSEVNWHSVMYAFEEMNVFEVAFGGGEPTMYPDFEMILRWFREVGITPNFTTKSMDWIRDSRQRNAIMKSVGRFAYSIGSKQEYDDFISTCRYHDVPFEKFCIQLVMGTMDQYEFARILQSSNSDRVGVTLLGYKEVGRGKKYKPTDYSWWIKEAKKYENIGIDTALARQYEKELTTAGVSAKLFHVEEGKFSAYYDAVKGTIAPSSYDGEAVPWDCRGEDSTERFRKIYEAW